MTEDELAAAEAELEEGETLSESGKAQAEAALARLQNGEDMITIIKEMEAEQESGRRPPAARKLLRKRPIRPSMTMW